MEITIATTVVALQGNTERLTTLDAGAIVIPNSSPDSAGLTEAICNGNRVRIFERDLEEKYERAEAAHVLVYFRSCGTKNTTQNYC